MDVSYLTRLRTALPPSNWRVEDYKTSFAWFWDLDAPKGDSLWHWLDDRNGEKNIFITWDGMPSLDVDLVNITNHLTPIDWALSLSRHLLFQYSKTPTDVPPLRIFILDCFSRELSNAHACRMVDSVLAALPWISVVRLLPFGRSDGRSVADEHGLEELKRTVIGDSATVQSLRSVDHNEASDKVETLIHSWMGSLTRSATHHDVNNILGPLVLIEALKKKPLYDLLGYRALRQHARWIGMTDQMSGANGKTESWFDARQLAREFGRTVRFILVDDQANTGWTQVVSAALGISRLNRDFKEEESATRIQLAAKEGQIELWTTTSTEPLIKRLNAALQPIKKSEKLRDLRFALQLTPNESSDGTGASPHFEILLLDLRIHADRASEVTAFRSIIEIADLLNVRNEDGCWPWAALPGGSHGVGGRLRSWLDEYANGSNTAGSRNSDTYLTMLALLSRVIATVDFSLPIILFSSSGQRRVTEEVKHYGNIITAFEKPRFVGYRSDDILRDTIMRWSAACELAADFLRARLALQHVRDGGKTLPKVLPASRPGKYTIELYVDETGDEFLDDEFVVGGVLVVGLESDVREFKKAIEMEYSRVIETATGGVKEIVRSNIREFAKFILQNGEANNVYVSSVKLTSYHYIGRAPEELPGAVENELEADNLYRELVSTLIECAIYQLGASICHEAPEAQFGVNLATRVKPIKDARDEQLALELRRRWDIQTANIGKGSGAWEAIDTLSRLKSDDPVLVRLASDLRNHVRTNSKIYSSRRAIRYLSFDAARPIVQGISRQYRLASFRPTAEHARAYLLNHPNPICHPLHLIADGLLSPSQGQIEEVKQLQQKGFVGEYDVNLRKLLSGARQASNGFLSEGLALAAQYAALPVNSDANDVRRLLLFRLAHMSESMSGSGFMRVVEALRESKKKPADYGPVQSSGEVIHVGSGFTIIKLQNTTETVKSRQPATIDAEQVRLRRGDQVSAEVRRSNPNDPRIELVQLLGYRRHPQWKEIKKGKELVGTVGIRTEHGIYVRFEMLDGFVDFRDAPNWSENPPRKGTTARFYVKYVDRRLGTLGVVPE